MNILITYKASAEEEALFREVLGGTTTLTFLSEHPATQRERLLEQADVLIVWNFAQEVSAQECARLRPGTFIQLVTAGADHVPFAVLPSHVTVASNAGAYAVPMAEHALAMILALTKRLFVEHSKLRHGQFDDTTPTRSLAGATAGIIGFGGAGQAIAHLMQAFGMRIYALNQSGTSTAPTDFIGTLRDLEHVLREADVVVLTLPLTRATTGLIGVRELAWMKPDAILVDIARGALIDEEALYTHAKSHPDFGIGIDAWWIEPLRGSAFRMDYPLLELPNILGSPHNSAVVHGIAAHAARLASENIQRFMRGERVTGVARREDYLV